MAGAWCTRGRRRAACARAWCLARSSFRSAPLPRCGACSGLPHASFVAYLDDVTVAAAPEHLEAACGAAAQAMEELGIKNNAAKMEVLDPTCLSGFGDARRLTCARVLARCGVRCGARGGGDGGGGQARPRDGEAVPPPSSSARWPRGRGGDCCRPLRCRA
ncbi:hypothetical protein ERJ75_001275700 [Trypanosoma vivax]|nr:hypothetical protein ERJ75_001275700 [Trypanosoma vivax]